MTERFNFYDIYGYVIPGLTFVALLFVPTAIVSRTWPNLEWSSAFVFLVVAYLSGLILNRLIARYVSTTVYDPVDPKRPYRYPSDILMDDNREAVRSKLPLALSDDLRQAVAKGILNTFGMDTARSQEVRNDAFLMCRSLLQAESASYAEQFEGLYTLCQTVSAVALLIGCYFMGWAVSSWFPSEVALPVGIIGAAVVGVGYKRDWPFIGLPLCLFAAGVVLGRNSGDVARDASLILLTISIGAGVVALVLFSAFRYFATLFAVAVYRDFAVLILAKDVLAADNDERGDKRHGRKG